MINRIKLLVAAAVALVAFAAAATSASAAEFAVANGGAVNAVSNGKITFTAGTATIACNLTLELNLNRGPISKVEGAGVGTLVREGVRWAECTGGNIRAVLGTPWEISYRSITGTLPSGVTAVNLNLLRTQFQFSIFFELVDCLYEGTAGSIMSTSLIRGTTERYTTSTIRSDESTTQSYVSGPESCPRTGSMRGTFNLSATQTITRT